MFFDVTYPRTVPARRPAGFKPPVQRYQLRWPTPVHTIVTDYFAIQGDDLPWSLQQAFIARARAALTGPNGPGALEVMRSRDTNGALNTIVVAYWLDPVRHGRWAASSDLVAWMMARERLSEPHGYWRETMNVPYDRHETNYSATDYRIGLARCAPGELAGHDTNAYFGAMRDRIPLSAIDTLDTPLAPVLERRDPGETRGRRIRVLTPLNLAAIRSGQFWAKAGDEQHGDYTQNLQPKLMRGMDHIENNKRETGCCTMRMMFNIDDEGQELDESSVLSYFLSLAHLEGWSHSHTTHLDIYHHAIAMMRKYGAKREVRTWHEVFVLPAAGGVFDYVNCHPETGLLPFFGRD